MYNGIGLQTPRGSGTNGHVQRNWAAVKPRAKENTYKTEEDLGNLDKVTHRQPNQEILDHERKRKIELKCAEFADILEEQGYVWLVGEELCILLIDIVLLDLHKKPSI